MSVELAGLIERVRNATGADREIDFDLELLFGDSRFLTGLINGLRSGAEGWEWGEGEHTWNIHHTGTWGSVNGGVSKRTASIDAALALVEQVLPGAGWSIVRNDNPATLVQVDLADEIADAATPPLAILLALLYALSKAPAHD